MAAIEREILEEIASQSGRYGDRLEALLGDMARLRQTIEPAMARLQQDGLGDSAAYQALNADIARYTELRGQAQRVQHYLIIHREAMGFWNHDTCSAAIQSQPPSLPCRQLIPQGLQSIPELLARLLDDSSCRLLAGALAGDVHYQPYLSAKTFGVGFEITPGYRRHDEFEQRVE